MAEFQEVLKHWERLGLNGCFDCPIKDECDEVMESTNGSNLCDVIIENAEKIEAGVMAWAAENPEPVYLTWYDYLSNMMTEPPIPIDDHDYVRWLTEHRIHADIAEKLGIKPKEVEKDG